MILFAIFTMWLKLVLFCTVLEAVISSGVDPDSKEKHQCGPHEVYLRIGPKCYAACLVQNLFDHKEGPCSVMPGEYCPGCYCVEGYIKSHRGPDAKCVPSFPDDGCKGYCRENEEYRAGSACPPSCQYNTPEPCPLNLVHGCYCKEGYIYDWSTDKCIPSGDCPSQ